jgi:hypothetical protein
MRTAGGANFIKSISRVVNVENYSPTRADISNNTSATLSTGWDGENEIITNA